VSRSPDVAKRNPGYNPKVTSLDQGLSYPWRCTAVAAAALAAGFLALSLVAMAQDQSAATAKDVIFARKTLMNSINDDMDRIGEMISQQRFNLDAARRHANDISVMLLAFPHLFPPSSNRWKENADFDPATDTIASPDIWTNTADFQRRAAGAAKTAHEMSRADSQDEVKRLHRALWIACDTCHALYLKE
jgi:cytochrome c556